MGAQYDGKEVAVNASAIGDVTVAYTTPIAIGAANRQISVPLATVRAGDVISARPLGAVPDGYDIGAAYCVTDGTLVVIVAHPAIVLGGNFSINLRIIRIMT